MNRFHWKPAATMGRVIFKACLTVMLLVDSSHAVPPKLTEQQSEDKDGCMQKYLDGMARCAGNPKLSVDLCYRNEIYMYNVCLDSHGIPRSAAPPPPKPRPPKHVPPKELRPDIKQKTNPLVPIRDAAGAQDQKSPSQKSASPTPTKLPRAATSLRTKSSATPTPSPTPQKR